RGDLVADLLELCDLEAGFAAARILAVAGGLEAGPAAVEPIGFVGAIALCGFELGVEAAAPIRLHLLDFAGSHHAFADELFAVDLERGRMLGNRLVHQRLGHRWADALRLCAP